MFHISRYAISFFIEIENIIRMTNMDILLHYTDYFLNEESVHLQLRFFLGIFFVSIHLV
jgi:hypothetical protein